MIVSSFSSCTCDSDASPSPLLAKYLTQLGEYILILDLEPSQQLNHLGIGLVYSFLLILLQLISILHDIELPLEQIVLLNKLLVLGLVFVHLARHLLHVVENDLLLLLDEAQDPRYSFP